LLKKEEEEKDNQKEFFYEFLKLFRKQNKNFFRNRGGGKNLFFQAVQNSTPPSLSNFEMNEKYYKCKNLIKIH
jgi:hypothetical protein